MNLERKKTLDLWLGGAALFVLKPIVAGLGVAMRRDHALEVRGDVFIMKLQGGGSLVLALPALLGMKRHHPERRLILICTPGVEAFARLLGVFDDFRVIDDRDLWCNRLGSRIDRLGDDRRSSRRFVTR